MKKEDFILEEIRDLNQRVNKQIGNIIYLLVIYGLSMTIWFLYIVCILKGLV